MCNHQPISRVRYDANRVAPLLAEQALLIVPHGGDEKHSLLRGDDPNVRDADPIRGKRERE